MPQIISADILGAEVEPRELRGFLSIQVQREQYCVDYPGIASKEVIETGSKALATCLERKPT